MSRARARLAVGLLILLVGGVVAWIFLRPIPRWVAIDPGIFYRSSLLDSSDLKRAVAEHGIRTVVNLRPDRDEAHREEAETLGSLGVALVEIPLDAASPPSPEQVRTLLGVIDDPARRPILAHCRHGSIRVGGIEALYRREYLGESAEEALTHASRFGHHLAEDAPRIAQFIRAYVPRTPAERAASGKTAATVPPK